MSHQEFITGYRDGTIEVRIDRAAAAQFMSARTMLPLVILPILGAGVAAALAGHFIAGLLIFLAGFAIRFAVRASSHGFVLARSLQDPAFFDDVVRKKILLVKAR